MEKTITIRGRYDQILFFDDEDRKTFRWACSLLPYHLKNDLRTHERCGRAVHIDFSEDTATIRVEAWEWTHQQIAAFLCKVYDSYFRRKYNRDGKQTKYSLE